MHILAINYIFFSLFLLAILIAKKNTEHKSTSELTFVAISFLVLAILHVFVDINSVEDLPGYESGFNMMRITPLKDIFDVFRKGDPLYAIINKALASITTDFGLFLLLYNILLLCSYFSVLRKFSPCVPISIVIFLAINYNQSLFVLRQYMAISFLVLSIPCIIHKRILPYSMLCLAAFFTHSSALIFFPLYFIYNIPNRKIFALTILLIMGFFASLNTDIGNYLTFLNVDYSEYIDLNANYNLTVTLIPIAHLVAFCLALRSHIFDDGINRVCFIALILYAAGYVFAPGVDLISRILKYYEFFLLFAVPLTFQYIRENVIKFAYLLSVICLHGYLSIRNLSEFYFANYQLGEINILYLIALIVVAFIVVKKYRTKNEYEESINVF